MHRYILAAAFGLFTLTVLNGAAVAQGTTVAFGNLQHDASLPVEVTSDELSVDQETGTAVFSGNVLVGQGDLRLSAARVEVVYSDDDSKIARLLASGGVTMTNNSESLEAQEAVYDLESSTVTLTGEVVLTQGSNVLSGNRMVIDLTSGTGRIDGRVRTILQTGGTSE